MAIYIAIGCLAFVCFGIFDLNKIRFMHKSTSIWVILGSLIISFSTVKIIISTYSMQISTLLQWFELLLAILALFLTVYTIFFAVSFKKTYIETEKGNTVVNTGMYALCRHPGVIWFFFFYLLLGLAFSNKVLLTATLVWTFLDIVYVYAQDRWIFPIMLEGYYTYKKQVPFLIPNFTSLRNCISPLLEKVFK